MNILDIISERQVTELKAPKFIRLGDPKTFAAYQRLLKSRAVKMVNKTNQFNAEWKKAYPVKSLWLIKFLGLAVAVGDLYVELSYAQEDYDAGKISQEDLQKYRQWAFGMFEVQVLTPYVAKALSNMLGVTTLVRWIVRLGGAASSGATLGASVAGIIASELFFQWLGKWLTSNEGRDFFSNRFVRPIIQTMGQWPEGVWSELVGYYNAGKGGDKAKDKVAPGAAGEKPGQQPAPEPGTPASIGAATKPAASNSVWNKPVQVKKSEFMGLSPYTPVPSTQPAR